MQHERERVENVQKEKKNTANMFASIYISQSPNITALYEINERQLSAEHIFLFFQTLLRLNPNGLVVGVSGGARFECI